MDRPALKYIEHVHTTKNTRRARTDTTGLSSTKSVNSSNLWITERIHSNFAEMILKVVEMAEIAAIAALWDRVRMGSELASHPSPQHCDLLGKT